MQIDLRSLPIDAATGLALCLAATAGRSYHWQITSNQAAVAPPYLAPRGRRVSLLAESPTHGSRTCSSLRASCWVDYFWTALESAGLIGPFILETSFLKSSRDRRYLRSSSLSICDRSLYPADTAFCNQFMARSDSTAASRDC